MEKTIRLTDQVSLSRVVAGCMRLVEAKLTPDEMLRFVRECVDMGVTTFDHAPVYGGFTVEEAFGDAVLRREPGLRKQIQLVTKTGIAVPGGDNVPPIYYDASRKAIEAEVNRSLQKLSTDALDLLLIHRPDLMSSPEETGAALDALVDSGKVLSVGVSNYTPGQLEALQRHMKTKLAAHQVEFSVAATGILEDGVLDDALARDMPLMAWSPFARGRVFTSGDEGSLRLKAALEQVADAHGTSAEVIVYAWLLAHPAGVLPITGTVKSARVRTAVDALEITLTKPEWYAILAASRGYNVP